MSADDAVREALTRLYPPADNTGVLRDVQARAAAGETGSLPGGGGGPSKWLPWIAGAVAVGLLAGGAGAAGLFGHPTIDVWESNAVGALARTATASDCPAGSPVTEFGAQQRVLVLAATADGGFVAVRDPADFGRQVWLPTDVVTLDAGQADLSTLPVRGCPEPQLDSTPVTDPGAPTPTPTPTSTNQPSNPAPPPPSDTSPPSIAVGTVSPQPLYGLESSGFCPTTSTVVVTASDASGVAAVSGSWNMAGGSATLQGVSGSSYTFGLSVPYTGFSDTTATVTFTATDGAGNSAAAATTFGVRATCLG